ncbi:3-oxoadipate enol-lactonase [Nitrospira sp. KM1]|uniref:alpha/beta fold hydrolase n=1 Tax=Nitrospira sp. KM1 TaxID=1936990 RepID=UPI0013A763C4|nr:alpha/beta fold hydrolase [Nitrospira sp. KM1]BCA54608.1 3-oxoadipate enol-lactonase [Nitrospira sp. KM1]
MSIVHVNGIPLNYRESGNGNGPTIVFAPSLIWSSDVYDELLGPLKDDFHIVALELHGHGQSGYRLDMTLEGITEEFSLLLKQLNLQRPAWLGCSIGGMIGMRLALAHPDVLDSLILVATSARPDPSQIKGATLHLWKMFRDGHRGDIADPALKLLFAARTFKECPDLIARCRGELIRTKDAAGMFAAALATINRTDISGEIHKIKTRTLVITGREDPAATPAQADFIETQIPGAEMAIIDDAGHMVALEKPGEVAKLVQGFLAKSQS